LTETGTEAEPRPTWVRRALQTLGLAILVLAFLPLYRLMDTAVEAPHREVSVQIAQVTLETAWWGTVVAVLLCWLLARLVPSGAVRRLLEAAARQLMRPSRGAFALGLACASAGLATLVGSRLYRGYFTNVDEIASTLHARYLANGLLAGPTFSMPEFWLIPNTLIVPEGWVSQFPPTHLVAMAGMLRLGAPMLLGPVAVGVLVGLLALSLPRLLPDRPCSARVASLVIALCPFVLLLGGGSMSHVSTGALGAAVLYTALRATDGRAGWAVLTGLAIGLMVADRPLIGLVLGIAFTAGLWLPTAIRSGHEGMAWMAKRAGATVLGGAPVALLLAWYTQRLFGAPFRLGYLAAFGDRHRLGFHMDPWGYEYGPAEALAFTSSDMLAAGIQLLETPFPVTAAVGLWLLMGARTSRGVGVLLAWALLPLLANAFYWFHDVRMLFEAAPAWVTLAVLSAGGLAFRGDTRWDEKLGARGRDFFLWATIVGVVGAVAWGVPSRLASYAWSQETLDRITAPVPPGPQAAVVFTHVSWNERLSSTLQGAGGMRQDSIISVLRRNTNCGIHRYAVAREALVREGRAVTLPEIDLEQAPGTHIDIERPATPSGASVRMRRGEPFPETCLRELRADRFGAVALAPLVWQGDLPGIERGDPLYVRDLGPEKNERLLARYPDRAAFVFTPTSVDAPPRLVPYDEAMDLLWGAPGADPGDRAR